MAGLTLLAAGSATVPRLAGGGALDISLTRIVAALVLCLMAAALVAILLKRSGGGRIDLSRLGALRRTAGERRIAVIESRRISPHADLCLLRFDGDEYLILSSATGQQIVRARPVGEAVV